MRKNIGIRFVCQFTILRMYGLHLRPLQQLMPNDLRFSHHSVLPVGWNS